MRREPGNYAGILGLALLMGGCFSTGIAEANPKLGRPELLDVFPESVAEVPTDRRGGTSLSSTYTPSGSLWVKGLQEEKVFLAEMKHTQGKDNSFSLRLGKGGQLYSLRGSFGESVPPQRMESPWNDEIWQFVAVCGKYNHLSALTKAGEVPEEALARFNTSPYKKTFFIHNSGAYIPSQINSGTITFSCDVMLDRETPGQLDIILRDMQKGWKDIGRLQVAAGAMRCSGVPLLAAEPGLWYHVEMSFRLGEDAGRKLTATASTAGGLTKSVDVPFADPVAKAFKWVGLSAKGHEAGVIYVDNLSARRVTGQETEHLLQEDFEGLKSGQGHWAVSGTAPEKGADALVTDRVAASGEKSFQMRDAPGLQHDWQPLMGNFISATKSGSFYCPLLGADVPSDGRTYRTVNWGIVPQLKTICRSPILYYVQTRDIGDGVIELTYVVHNFSVREDIDFNFLNVPWGGTRISSLPYRYYSTPDGAIHDLPAREFGKTFGDTGGWILACASKDPDSPSVAIVYGRDRHLEEQRKLPPGDRAFCQIRPSFIRGHRAGAPANWETRPENSWRNYDVVEAIFWASFLPGQTFFYRSYLVVGGKQRAIELADRMVNSVDYGLLSPSPEDTPRVPVYTRDGRVVDNADKPSFKLLSRPVPGTMPLFLIENTTTGAEVITTDPYIFVPQEKLDFGVPPEHPHHDYYSQAVGYSMDQNNSNWKKLLGYGYVEKPEGSSNRQLSSLLDESMFPQADTHHLDLWVQSGN